MLTVTVCREQACDCVRANKPIPEVISEHTHTHTYMAVGKRAWCTAGTNRCSPERASLVTGLALVIEEKNVLYAHYNNRHSRLEVLSTQTPGSLAQQVKQMYEPTRQDFEVLSTLTPRSSAQQVEQMYVQDKIRARRAPNLFMRFVVCTKWTAWNVTV